VRYRAAGRVRAIEQMHDHQAHGIGADYDEIGRLTSAARYKEGVMIAEMIVDQETGSRSIHENPVALVDLIVSRAASKTRFPSIPTNFETLLTNVVGKGEDLLREASIAFGMFPPSRDSSAASAKVVSLSALQSPAGRC
jgi:hypothetical protein